MKRTVANWEQLIGERIKRARLDKNLTQNEVAERCGITQLTISKLESGKGSRLSTLINVMKVLDLEEQFEMLVPPKPVSPIQILQRHAPR